MELCGGKKSVPICKLESVHMPLFDEPNDNPINVGELILPTGGESKSKCLNQNQACLSRDLHNLSTAITRCVLPKVHSNCYVRLNSLVSHDAERAGEYSLLKRFLKANKMYTLVACEYTFDDGSSKQGHGDALLYEASTNTLIVLECKLCRSDPFFGRKRKEKARLQAHTYTRRMKSWLNHLINVDSLIRDALGGCRVVGAFLVDVYPFTLTFLQTLESHDLYLA